MSDRSQDQPLAVSGLLVDYVLSYVEMMGGQVDPLLEGLPEGRSRLTNRFSWVDWETYLLIESRVAEALPGVPDPYVAMGRHIATNPRVAFLRPAFRALAAPILVYRLIPRVVPLLFIRSLQIELSEHASAPGHLSLRYTPLDGQLLSDAFLDTIWGQLVGIPAIFDAPDARVERLRDGSAVEFEVFLSDHASAWWPGVRRRLSRVGSALGLSPQRQNLEMLKELLDTNELLATKVSDLEQANLRLQMESAARRRAVQASLESEARYRLLADTAQDAIYVLEADGRFRYVNSFGAAMLDLSPGQLMGRRVQELRASPTDGPAPMGEAALRRVSEVLDSGEMVELEHASFLKEKGRWYHTRLVPIMDGSRRPEAVLGVTRDITAIRQAERERRLNVARAQRLHTLESLSVLAGGIAHDFNNLLTIVGGNAEVAGKMLSKEHGARRPLNAIQDASRRAAELCRLLLAYAGRGEVELRALDISQVVRDTEGLVLASAPEGVSIRLDLATDLPAVVADPAQVRQILLNLVSNAGEACAALPPERSGEIQVRTALVDLDPEELGRLSIPPKEVYHDAFCLLEVRDTGVGMAEGVVDRVFDPLFSTKFAGRGLGLSSVLGIVRRQGGGIGVESILGKGTSFRIYLPSTSGAPDRREPAPPEPSLGPLALNRVLLVDDERDVREVGQHLLESVGIAVQVAGNGVDALRILRESPGGFDIVILDLAMPDMDGFETHAELRQMEPRLPVLISTGYDITEVAGKFEGDDRVSFLQKPYELVDLLEAIRRVAFTDQPSAGTP